MNKTQVKWRKIKNNEETEEKIRITLKEDWENEEKCGECWKMKNHKENE